MKLMALYPRGAGRVEAAFEHLGVGYSFQREIALDWSAVDACYPLKDKTANDKCLAAKAALVEKHRAEFEKWGLPLVERQVADAEAAKAEADASYRDAVAVATVLGKVAQLSESGIARLKEMLHAAGGGADILDHSLAKMDQVEADAKLLAFVRANPTDKTVTDLLAKAVR